MFSRRRGVSRTALLRSATAGIRMSAVSSRKMALILSSAKAARTPGQLHVNALIPGGDRALDDTHVLTGLVVHCLCERFFGLPARTCHQRFVIFERDYVQDQIAQVRVRGPEKRLGAACAVLKMQPDHGRTDNLRRALITVRA